MTKGLHKNSLRKVDNPHQWMIDDARMELIQQIKAEVEKRIKRNKEEYAPDGLFEVQDNLAKLLNFLDTIQEQPVCENPRPTSAPKTFRYNDRKYHIVTSFEDNGEIHYVVKYFGRYKQWWHYEVLSSFELALQTK